MSKASFMAWTEQNPDKTFSQCVKHLLQEKVMDQKDLAAKSCLSETTISRILRDWNDKGATYHPTEEVIAAISLSFELGTEGYEILRRAAFPQVAIWQEALKDFKTVAEANEDLQKKGLPLLGSTVK
jgi:transcriptional regulator with XRE-family HTH domain